MTDDTQTAALVLMRPAVSIDMAKQAWAEYQELTKAILDGSDYQDIGGKPYKKKSAWRKYGKFYALDEDPEQTKIETTRDETGYPIFSKAFVVIKNRAGQQWSGYHECHVKEKCCPESYGEPCYKEHDHCLPNCSGKRHFSHPGDIPATAHTRAKNRAISDAIGAGEVSAEELEPRAETQDEGPKPPKVLCPKCGKPGRKSKWGGYFCWEQKGGCGHKWNDETPAGAGAANGDTPPATPDLFDKEHEKLVAEEEAKRKAKKAGGDPATGLPVDDKPINRKQMLEFTKEAHNSNKTNDDVVAVLGILELSTVEAIPQRSFFYYLQWAKGELSNRDLAKLLTGVQ